ncbi:hypothetical protein KKA02_04685 [Patescibacteria group bacterium]|nr:hypothetical protein [Patescibacteria group bacterium]
MIQGKELEDYIQKIILLEKRAGAKVGYQMLEPFTLDSKDIIAIQTAAKKIAEFIGLQGLIFIIATTKQKEKIGGHVELKYGEKEVFVEISDGILEFNDAVLATLVHEISHKYLHINGISCGIGPAYEYENEILTDITTAFLGLGKLMLNGCECKHVRQEQIPNGINTITQTLKSGYLDRSQMAFVYRLICAMRKISSRDYERGLSSDSIISLRECGGIYGGYFDNRFHKFDTEERLIESLRSAISDIQLTLSDIDRSLLYIQEGCLKFVEMFLEKTHKRLHGLFLGTQKTAGDNEYDPCLKFLNAKLSDQATKKLVSEVNDYSSELNQYKRSVTKLANDIQEFSGLFPKPKSDMFTIVTCRNDGTRLKFPKDKPDFIARCTKCRYQFTVDTSVPLSKKRKVSSIFRSLFGKK